MIHQFGIHLKVRDINRSLSFYKLFGFNEIFGLGSEEFLGKLHPSIPKVAENYNGVVFEIGNALFEIADGHVAVKKEVFQEVVPNSKLSAMIYVDSVEHIDKVCRKNKIHISVPIRKYHWGTKEVVIKDPDGFVLVFIERLEK